MLGAGTYAVRSRLVNAGSGRTSGWSPEVLVAVQR
jgi:hypothetical protein